MAEYVLYFETEAAFNEKREEGYIEPWLSFTKNGKRMDYNKTEHEKLLVTPFTIEGLEAGTINWALGNKTVQYSRNKGKTWSTMDSGTTLQINKGEKILFKGTNSHYCGCTISASADFEVKGNIMSLTNGDDFKSATTLNNNAFRQMFQGNEHLVSADWLKLPAITLGEDCYREMFSGCTGLISVPELPAMTLTNGCYDDMFHGCTKLVSAPELPAMTLANHCYEGMFYGCTKLVSAPELPATTLAEACYYGMFYNCTSLVSAPELPVSIVPHFGYRYMFYGSQSLNYVKCLATDLSAGYCTNEWLNKVSTYGVFVKNKNMESWSRDGHGIPSKWIVCEDELTIIDKPDFYYSGDVKTVRVYSDSDWVVTSCPNWLTIDITSGESGFYTIVMTARANNTGVRRTGNFTVQTTDGLQTKTVELVQLTDPENSYLTFFIKSNGNLYWKADDTVFTRTIEYNKNNEGWSAITSNTNNSAPAIPVQNGDVVEFRGDNATYTNDDNKSNKISASTDCDIYGNIMSMIDSTGFTSLFTLDQNVTRTFRNFFDAVPVIDASKLILPATTLTFGCYINMFRNCKKLVLAPKLPSKTLADNCYQGMFTACSSLVVAPKLPSTNIAAYCYDHMFWNCTALTTTQSVLPAMTLCPYCYCGMYDGCKSLTDVPELPAKILAPHCYGGNSAQGRDYGMFTGCVSLKTAPQLPATTLANNCYQTMFSDCTSLINVPELPATELADFCYDTMFKGCTSLTVAQTVLPATEIKTNSYCGMYSHCTSLTTPPVICATTVGYDSCDWMFSTCTSLTVAPELPATALSQYSYRRMFIDCINLTEAPELPATTLADDCYRSMFQGCTSLTEAPELPASALTSYCYGYMFSGCTSLVTPPELPATTLAKNCYANMFYDCTSLSTAPALCATTLMESCYNSMFYNCTSLTSAPELPATTIKKNSYKNMFNGCSSLNYVKALFTTDPEGGEYTTDWLNGVSQTGTFVKNASATWTTTGPNGVPNGWTVQTA